ncbi:MAG: hypothetical protein MPN21_11800 [Thermoanaerobaculia bacterium]|nr:hypothetical protein [Thermoanaerobaculia bacterium]
MPEHLLTPILEDGVRHTHFFHGRLLSADDLRAEQEAHRRHQQQLGRAIGGGVVSGLWPTMLDDGSGDSPPTLSVTRGLAVDLLGTTLELPRDLQLFLTRDVADDDRAGLFDDCDRLDTGLLGVGDGLYLLVMGPASGYQERAPKSGLGETSIAGCGSRYAVEGVRFRLARIDVASLSGVSESTRDELTDELLGATLDDLDRLSRLRNVAAHLAFASESLGDLGADPFARIATEPQQPGRSPLRQRGLVDDLRRLNLLTDCEVPLALLAWTLEGVQFLDRWSVRRRPVVTSPDSGWPTIGGSRATGEAEARFLQFQEHLDWLLGIHPAPSSIAADDHFRYLPPAGLLPIERAAGGNVDFQTFFGSRPWRHSEYPGRPEYSGYPELMDAARLGPLLESASAYPATDLEEAEKVWLYLPAVRAVGQQEPRARAPYMVFAGPHLPPWNTARFDVARWDYSNHARRPAGDTT